MAVLLLVLCCAIGPAIVGAVGGSVIGGWLGMACAVVLAAATALILNRNRRTGRC